MHERLLAVLAVTFALLFAGFSPAAAKLVTTEKTRHFTVSGSNGKALLHSMVRAGKRSAFFSQRTAWTESEFVVTSQSRLGGGKCVVTDIVVKLNLTYNLPQWKTRNAASKAVVVAWERYLAELTKHEHTHGAIAKKSARSHDATMKNVLASGPKDCTSVRARVRSAFDKLQAQHRAEQMAFDARERRSSSKVYKLQMAFAKAK